MLWLGVNPETIRGSRTGVFVGCMWSEAFDMLCSRIEQVTGQELTVGANTMLPNRLSYFFDFKGVCSLCCICQHY